jgi:hypothetical protein
MRIDSLYFTNVPVAKSGATSVENDNEDSKTPSTSIGKIARSHTPSDELVQVLNRLRELPEVRLEKLEEVAQRLASGYYQTAEANQRTAEAVLNAAD